MTLFSWITLFAEGEAPAAQPQAGNPFGFMIIVVGMLAVMYVFMVLPKQRAEKNAKKMVDSLNKNDKVMTTSGMIGIIYSIDREAGEVVLKVDESNNTKIKFSTGAIYYVFSGEKEKENKETNA